MKGTWYSIVGFAFIGIVFVVMLFGGLCWQLLKQFL